MEDSRCSRIDGATDVIVAEAPTARDGVWFAQHMGHYGAVLQSDNEQVISTLNSRVFSAPASLAIFHDFMLHASAFDDVSYGLCPREVNVAAHEIARSFFFCSDFCTWVDETHSFLMQSLINDVTIFDKE
jgi:hypothetical protein